MAFDPYYKWLGIPPAEQPPNYYRLLGLSLFELNSDAIENAADRQMGHVRTFQAGPQGADSQRLLNEIATARLVLLDATRRRAYDEQLRSQLTAAQTAAPLVVEVASAPLAASPQPQESTLQIVTGTAPAVQVQPRDPAASRRPPKDITVEILKIVGGGIAGIVLATILLRLGFGIDMTGLFPVEQPKKPPVVQRPKPIEVQNEKQTSKQAATGSAKEGPTATAQSSAVMEEEEYDDPTPEGAGKKKKKKRKGKTKPATTEQSTHGAVLTVARMKPVPTLDQSGMLPELLGGTRFDWIETPTAVNVDLGRLEFTVQRTGWVFLVADWNYEGNESGGWKDEAKTKEQLVSEGWEHVGRCPWGGTEEKPLELFRKVCTQDESYSIRVNKYGPPLVFVPPTGDAAPVDLTSAPPTPVDPPPSTPPQPAGEFKVVSTSLQPGRLPAPSDAERQAAEQALEAAYQLSKLEEDAPRQTLVTDLLGVGTNRTTPPAQRWVTLKTAADLAAEAGDARLVAQAMDALAQAFEPDVLTEEAAHLVKASRGARTGEQIQALVEASRTVIQLALVSHDYVLARDLASAVRNASDRPAGQPFRKFIFDGQREIVRQQETWYAYREATTRLANAPEDAEANLVAAKWWIFERGDWDAALPHLSKSGKPLVKAAADLDAAKGNDWLAIANAWYDAGMAEPVTPLWLVRAQGWYAVIDRATISGLDGASVDRRVDELAKNAQLAPLAAQIALGRGAARVTSGLAPVVRRHCVLLMPFERADHFHVGKSYMVCDRSGQANHGAVYGVTPAAGQAGMALEFAGPEHYVECPDRPSLNPEQALTICAWIKQLAPVQPQGMDDLLSKEEWGGGTGRGYSLRIHQGRPNFDFGNGPDWLQIDAPQPLDQGVWVHIAGVYDGQNETLLINGLEFASQATSKTISKSPQPLRIGRGPFAQDRRFHGIVDEVAVFEMALTAEDLRAIIELGRAGKSLSE